MLPVTNNARLISTHAPAGGATRSLPIGRVRRRFLLTPLREGRPGTSCTASRARDFYSRPCGRGDLRGGERLLPSLCISTHAPAGGATRRGVSSNDLLANFYSRPCGRGDAVVILRRHIEEHFYSRPCGRGDETGRRGSGAFCDFYSRPCGRGDIPTAPVRTTFPRFLLTPLREGRPKRRDKAVVAW